MPSKTPTVSEQARSLLSAALPDKLIDELLEHYQALKTAFLATDWEKCLLRGGKLAEATMKILRFLRTGNVVSSINVEDETQQVQNSNLPDEVRLLVPRHVRPLYDHRTKRGGAHGSFDPNPLDAGVVVPLADWIVGELVRLYGKTDPETALRLVTNLTARLVPLTQEIDGDVVVFQKGSCREQLLLALRRRHPERTKKGELRQWIKRHKQPNIDVTLGRMAWNSEIHTNQDGILLTDLGLREADEIVAKSLA